MIDGICLDVRTSVVPTIFGEKMVLRLLNMKRRSIMAKPLECVRKIMRR